MADTAQALNPADAGEVDDGLDATERAQFAEMEKVTSDPAPSPEPSPTPAPAPVPAPVAGDAPAADAEDEDEDGEEAAAGAALPAGAPAAAGTAPPKRRVSARKYEREVAARQKAETEAKTLRDSQARLDERMRILNEALTAGATPAAANGEAPAEEDPEPDPEKDVFAWIKWKGRDDARLRAEIAEERQGRQAQTEETTVANTYMDDARAFAQTEPNFVPAYQYLMANRTFELAQYFFGIDLSEPPLKDANGQEISPLNQEQLAKIRQTIGAEERQLATEAIGNKQSPAKRIFALAKARGWRPAAPAPAADAKPAADAPAAGNGAAAPAAAAPGALNAPAAAPRVEEEIARIKAGSEASRSLSSGGGAPPNSLTPEKLANMPQEEFDYAVANMSPEELRQFFGA